jgi:hypothetical protein
VLVEQELSNPFRKVCRVTMAQTACSLLCLQLVAGVVVPQVPAEERLLCALVAMAVPAAGTQVTTKQ